MSSWKSTLRLTEMEGLVADVQLPNFLQTSAPVLIHFSEFDDREELLPQEETSVDTLLQQLPNLANTVADTAFKHYQWIYKEYRRIYGEQLEMPVAANSVELRSFYQLRTIYLPEEVEKGRFGLGFSCDWEKEHDFGMQFRNWEIVEVGGDAEAFSFYD
ncbi:hypothetical protein H8B15_08835 [Hymenobacter sp. BT507]|uniref:DUF6985 domain-containing protein n=1 Tax=Hymenobacter citatus TaxID=2763506 RepID=A0ABR7MIW2_9BACT|nr:hypothetical protein [Hymenobacter citatus]MBC6611027.1 hypothetical protein [Hymenobacter citatus]